MKNEMTWRKLEFPGNRCIKLLFLVLLSICILFTSYYSAIHHEATYVEYYPKDSSSSFLEGGSSNGSRSIKQNIINNYSISSPSPWITIANPILQANFTEMNRRFLCRLESKPSLQNTIARVFIFQKNGGTQLLTALSHYLYALPPDAIVVIDHDSYEPASKELKKYVSQGVHLWKCSGNKNAKGPMWSAVIDVYKNYSEYVFPVDVDELITVQNFDNSLHWNTSILHHALSELKGNLSGKPLKLLNSNAIPVDCFDTSETFHQSTFCQMKYAPKQTRAFCMHKCFSRGKDFYSTDLGNHHLVTHRTTMLAPHLNNTGYNIYNLCVNDGIDHWYETTRLVTLHVQKLDFRDWVIHTLRGASTAGFTRQGFNCSTVSFSTHYCERWMELVDLNFSTDKLLEVYKKRFCQIDLPNMYNLSSLFDHMCHKL
jgi:hypothetical protein